MSVFAKIAAAKAGTEAEKTFSKAMQQYLQQQLLQKQALERLLAQQKFQRELEAMREQDAWRRLQAQQEFQAKQAGLNRQSALDRIKTEIATKTLSNAAASGYLPTTEAAKITSQIISGDISPDEALGLAINAMTKASSLKRLDALKNAWYDKLLALSPKADPNKVQEAAQYAANGQFDKAAKTLGVSVAEVQAHQREVNEAATKALIEQRLAGAEQARAGAELARANTERIRTLLGPEIDNLKAKTKLTEEQTQQIIQAIAFNAQRNPLLLQGLEMDNKLKELSIEEAKALVQLDWKRVADLEAQTQQRLWELAKSQKEFEFELPIKAYNVVDALAAKDYNSAVHWIEAESDTLKKAHLDPEKLKEDAKRIYEANKYNTPKILTALNAVQIQLKSPPADPKDDDKVLGNVKQRLIEAGLGEKEAQQAVDTLKGAWDVLRRKLTDQEREIALREAQVKLSGITDKLKADPTFIKEARAWLNLQRQTLQERRQTVQSLMASTGCLSSLFTGQGMAIVMQSSNRDEKYCQKALAPLRAELVNINERLASLDSFANSFGLELIGRKPEQTPQAPTDPFASYLLNLGKDILSGKAKPLTPEQMFEVWKQYHPNGDQKQWEEDLKVFQSKGYVTK